MCKDWRVLYRVIAGLVMCFAVAVIVLPEGAFASEAGALQSQAVSVQATSVEAENVQAASVEAENVQAASSDYSLKFNGRAAKTSAHYFNVPYIVDLVQKEKITVTDHGVATDFNFRFNDFYDSQWKSLTDYGFAIGYQWTGEEKPDPSDMFSNIGKTYHYQYILYRPAEKKSDSTPENPDQSGTDQSGTDQSGTDQSGTDQSGTDQSDSTPSTPSRLPNEPTPITEFSEDDQILAYTEPIAVTAVSDNIDTTIDGIMYLVYEGSETATIVDAKNVKTKKGKLKIPAHVTIKGKSYPVTKITDGVFRQTEITSLELPDTMRYIGTDAFINTKLKQISIPDSLNFVSDGAFGFTVTIDVKQHSYTTKKIPGFVVFAKSDSAGADYAVNNGFTLVDEKVAAGKKAALKAKPLKNKKASLTWKKLSNVTGYEVWQSHAKAGKFTKTATIKKSAAKKWTSKKLKAKTGSKVYFKIKPYTKVGSSTVYGKWSKTRAITVK